MNDNLLTFEELMVLSGFSHNTVSKKLKKLMIEPAAKKGRNKLYTKSDLEKIINYRPVPYNPNTTFYRISIFEELYWHVVKAGLTLKQAKKYLSDYENKGFTAKIISCKKA